MKGYVTGCRQRLAAVAFVLCPPLALLLFLLPSISVHAATTLTFHGIAGGTVYELRAVGTAPAGSKKAPVELPFAPQPNGTLEAVTSGDINLQVLEPGTPDRSDTGSALTIRDCEDFQVFLLGESSNDLCKALSEIAPANASTTRLAKFDPTGIDPKDRGGIFYQTGRNWLQLVFQQSFRTQGGTLVRLRKPKPEAGTNDFFADLSVYDDGSTGKLSDEPNGDGIDRTGTLWLRHPMLAPRLAPAYYGKLLPIGNGAVVKYTDKQATILAPGASLSTPDNLCVRIGALTDSVAMAQLVGRRTPPPTAEEIAASRRENGCGPGAAKAPSVLFLTVVNIVVLGSLAFAAWFFWLRRKQKYYTGMPAPRDDG